MEECQFFEDEICDIGGVSANVTARGRQRGGAAGRAGAAAVGRAGAGGRAQGIDLGFKRGTLTRQRNCRYVEKLHWQQQIYYN